MNKLHTATVGNPAMRMPGGLAFPSLLGVIPGVEAGVSAMIRKQMDKLDIPPVDEFLEMIIAGAITIPCQSHFKSEADSKIGLAKFANPFQTTNIQQLDILALHINQPIVFELFHHPDHTFG